MAITVGSVTGKLTIDGGSTADISFGTLPNAGSTVIVYLATYNDASRAALSVGDNQGNTYIKDKEINNNAGAGLSWASIWRASNVNASGTFTVTVTLDNSSGYASGAAVEVRGLETSSVVDQTNSANDDGINFPASDDAGAITTTQASEYIAACMALGGFDSQGIVSPSGYANRFNESDASTHQGGSGDDKILSATGTETPTWSWNNGTFFAGVVVSYKGAAEAGVPTVYGLKHNPAAGTVWRLQSA